MQSQANVLTLKKNNKEDPKFVTKQTLNCVRISKYKNIFARDYVPSQL